MAGITPLMLVKPVLLVAGLAAVGMGSYNLVNTGCPLGSCSTSNHDQTPMTTVSASGNTRSMAGGCSMHMAPAAVAEPADCPMKAAGCAMGNSDCDTGCDMAPGAAMVSMQSNPDCPHAACSAADMANCTAEKMADCPHGQCTAEDMANCTPDMAANCPMKDHCQGGEGECPFKGQMSDTPVSNQSAQSDEAITSDSEG